MRIHYSNETTKKLRTELIIAQRLNNLRLYKTVKTLLLIAEQVRKKDIAKLFNISTRTVYNWLLRFLSEGFSWLLGHHYRGRGCKSRLSKKQKKKLYDIIVNGTYFENSILGA